MSITLFFVLFFVCAAVVGVAIKEGSSFLMVFFLFVSLFVGSFLYANVAYVKLEEIIKKEDRGIELPVIGEKRFHAELLITYKNGKFESASLVSGTMKPLGVVK